MKWSGMFTRQAWEGGIQQAIDKVASSRRENRLGAERFAQTCTDLSPEASASDRRLHRFRRQLAEFFNSLRQSGDHIADVTDQLTLISDVASRR